MKRRVWEHSEEAKKCEQCGRAFHPIKQNLKRQQFCSRRCSIDNRNAFSRSPEAFWKLVEKTNYCWIWTGNIGQHGYGQSPLGGDAHRRAWELVNGYKPPMLRNGCGNRKCVRPHPEHWRPVHE